MKKTATILKYLQEYNTFLSEGGQEKWMESPSVFEEPNTVLKAMGYGIEVIGHVDIPKIEVNLPIYLGATPEHMSRGAAHMTWTSLPIGGESTNACLIGYRNLAKAEMFRHIDLLKLGDTVTIQTPWDELEYSVADTQVTAPHQIQFLKIQPGWDLLTLVAGHPRKSNERRYLVICERVE